MPQPIGHYCVIGNLRTHTLVGSNGSIGRLCPPGFDSPSVKEPKWMDEKADGKSLVEIYRLNGDRLTIAFRNRENDPARPTDFEPSDGVGIYVLVRKKY